MYNRGLVIKNLEVYVNYSDSLVTHQNAPGWIQMVLVVRCSTKG